ncbi:MAG: chondroitin AC lyase [Candidatus Latescibacterota bacterium]|jgi:chondroitin AC lyase
MYWQWICIWLLTPIIGASAEEINMATPKIDDMAVIKERMLAPLMDAPYVERANDYRQTLQSDGHWEEVNYEGTATTSWEPAQHLRRLITLTQAWFSPESPLHQDPELDKQINTALDYWLHKDPRRRWWWDAIGAPGMLSQIMLMRDGHLSDFQMSKGGQNVERAVLGTTGQNLVWQAEITARRAVIQRDADLLRRAFELIASELRISDGEGIQADFSFHQHKQVIYNHGYGSGFARDNVRLANLMAGTPFAYSPEKIALLSHYILDGSQWLSHNGQGDFGARGREIAVPRRGRRSAAYLGGAAEGMLTLPTGREKEFQALADRVAGNPAPPLVGNKHFYRSDMMVHHRPGWYASARMYSTRTFNTDGLSGTDDGLFSHYLAEGTTCLMQHGNEYGGLYPVWDWQSIPGTTVVLEPHIPGEPKRQGESAFAGGVSDGTMGVAAFELKREALSAQKSWFFFNDMIVCLGADITCDATYDVVTTANQCRLSGPVTLSKGNSFETFPEGNVTQNLRWVHHDGIGYLFPKESQISLTTGARTGTWKRISAQRSDETVTDSVFTLTIPHGAQPKEKTYVYAVFPGKESTAMLDLAHKMPFEIVANSAQQQAVWCESDKALGIVFRQPGQIQAAGWQVSADRACVLLLRLLGETWTLSAADPSAGNGTLSLIVKQDGEASRPITLTLPEGQMAGSTVHTTL